MYNLLFVTLGAWLFFIKLLNYGKTAGLAANINKEMAGIVLDKEEKGQVLNHGCLTFIFYIWLFLGFFTTEFFPCIVYLFLSTIEYVMSVDGKANVWKLRICTILDAIFIVFVTANLTVLHIDVQAYIQGLIY